jgi:hypothetical protein
MKLWAEVASEVAGKQVARESGRKLDGRSREKYW